MIKHVVKRLLLCVLVLFGVVCITFLITHVLPSDPALKWAGPKASAEQIEKARVELGLDKPLYAQFVTYFSGLLRGDLGTSYLSRRPVTVELQNAIPATLELVFYAIILSIIFGTWMGIYAAKHKNKLIDHLVRLFSMGTVSIPSFALALLLQLFFFSFLKILPMGGRLSTMTMVLCEVPNITGWLTVDCLITGNWEVLGDAFQHIILPCIPIALYPMGSLARMTRSSLLEVLGEDYITAERSYGIKESLVLWKLALKNTIGTTATVTALNIGYTLVNTFLIEAIFSWPGIGSYVSDAVLAMDYPAIMGVTLFSTVAYLILNLVADLIVAIDPRVRR